MPDPTERLTPDAHDRHRIDDAIERIAAEQVLMHLARHLSPQTAALFPDISLILQTDTPQPVDRQPDTESPAQAARRLVSSDDPQEKKAGELISRMLDSSDEKQVCMAHQLIAINQNLFHSNNCFPKLVEMLSSQNSDQIDMVTRLLALYSETSGSLDRRAGGRIMEMYGSGEARAVTDANTLMEMIQQGGQSCEHALNIAGRIDDPRQIHELLRLAGVVSRPPEDQAASRLLNLLRSDQSAPDAQRILGLLAGNEERASGDLVLDILKNGTPQDCDSALRILRSTTDFEQRRQLLLALRDPERRAGVAPVLDGLAGRPADQTAARNLMDILGSVRETDARLADELLNRLGRAQQAEAARTILAHCRSNEARNAILEFMTPHASEERQRVAARILAALEGTPAHRNAANAFLELPPRSKEREFLTEWLGDANASRADDALAVLTGLTEPASPQDLSKMIELLRNKPNDPGVLELMRLLGTGNSDDRATVVRALALMQSNDGGIRRIGGEELSDPSQTPTGDGKAGEALLSMLGGSAEQRELAGRILSTFNDRTAQETLVKMVTNTDDPHVRAVGARLANFPDSSVAERIATTISGTAKIERIMDILGSNQQPRAVEHIREMLLAGGQRGRSVDTLVGLLESPALVDRTARVLGEQLMYLLDFRDPVFDEQPTEDKPVATRVGATVAEEILSSGLSPARMADLLAQMRNRNTVAGAHRLAGILGQRSNDRADFNPDNPPLPEATGGRDYLDMLASRNEDTRSAGLQLQGMLNGAENLVAQKILENISGVEPLKRFLSALNNPVEKAGAEELLKLFDHPNNFVKQAARDLVAMLGSNNGQEQTLAKKVLDMLSDSQQRARAIATIETFSRGQLRDGLRISDADAVHSPADKALSRTVADLTAGNSQQRQAAQNIVSILTRPSNRSEKGGAEGDPNREASSTEAETLRRLIADPTKKDQALTVLSTLDSPIDCNSGLALLSDRPETAKVILDMLSSSNEIERRSAQSLLQLRNSFDFTGATGPNAYDRLIDGLNNPETREVTQRALSLGGSVDEMRILADVLALPDGEKVINRLHQLQQNPLYRSDIASTMGLLTQTQTRNNNGAARDLATVAEMLGDGKDRSIVETINLLAGDVDPALVRAARRILSHLSSDNPDLRRSGEQMAELMRNSDFKDTLGQLLSALDVVPSSFMRGLGDNSKAFIRHLLDSPAERRTNIAAIRVLTQMLLNESTRAEGERLLSMLNQPVHQNAVLRLLRQRIPDSAKLPAPGE